MRVWTYIDGFNLYICRPGLRIQMAQPQGIVPGCHAGWNPCREAEVLHRPRFGGLRSWPTLPSAHLLEGAPYPSGNWNLFWPVPPKAM